MYLYITQIENNVNIIILGEKKKRKKRVFECEYFARPKSINKWLIIILPLPTVAHSMHFSY